ncbi:Dihydrofolate reductase [Enhydrobacter aerosaccus]|uniref:Dihydrofolate reductase n=1 Tax=Enhydrobacter aerosaccus TaxID=225324 RepID=A0A1T4NL37_9HYPH|nr:dihydrofolate reductase family protein [Enhydrobacter aerosaccus]SJZ80001.1 Dihydrofolate reductase [Enhydrobacter aerosaccus]
MTGTVWHCHIAVSLDGKIARPDGSFDWLEGYPAEEFGIGAFLAGVDGILMGRQTYEAIRRMGDWPYPGKRTIVMTHRPLPDPPEGVEARSGDLGAVAAGFEQGGCRRVWIEGGSQVIQGMIAARRFDVLEMALIPIVLGDGIPLFRPGTPELHLRLASCTQRSRGALHLVYEVAHPA